MHSLQLMQTDANSALHSAYVQLAQMKSALTKENAELKRLEADHATEKQVTPMEKYNDQFLSDFVSSN